MRKNNVNILYNQAFYKREALCFFMSILFSIIFLNSSKAQLFDINISKTQDLSFGSFYVGASGGTITITPEGNRSVTGTIIPLAGSSVFPAIFNVSSTFVFSRSVHLVFPASAQLTRVGGSQTMTINNFTSNKPTGFNTCLFCATVVVRVGGTLQVANLTVNPPGNYRGTLNVMFVYE
jgi:hypothetical protein